MERVTGIGGVFFRAEDPEALTRWYAEHLGVAPPSESYETPSWWQEAGPTVFAPMPSDSAHFGGASRSASINFRVTDLDAMVRQLRNVGVEVEVDPELSERQVRLPPGPRGQRCPALGSRRGRHPAPRLAGPTGKARAPDGGENVTILDVGRATLELSNPEQVEMIDRVEVGRRVAPWLRVAFEVGDVAGVTDELVEAGAELLAAPTRTPWDSLNARLEGPAGLQLTLFEELT